MASMRARTVGDALLELLQRGIRRAASASSIAWRMRPSALRHALALGPFRDALEHFADVDGRVAGFDGSFERGDPGVLVFGLHRDVDELARVGEAVDGVGRCLRIDGMARHGAEQPGVVNTPQRGGANGVVRRGLGDRREVLLVAEPFKGERRVRIRRRRGGRHANQAVHVPPPQLLVSLSARELDDVLDPRQPRASGTPHPQVGVFARQLPQHLPVLVIVWQVGDSCRPHQRIRMLPFGLKETIEERHERSLTNAECIEHSALQFRNYRVDSSVSHSAICSRESR